MPNTASELAPDTKSLPQLADAIATFTDYEVPWDWFLEHDHQPLVPNLQAPPPPDLVRESTRKSAMFVSDLHMSDGSVVDDFYQGRLFRRIVPGTTTYAYFGDRKASSLAPIFARAIPFLSAYLTEVSGEPAHDVVLNGDIIDLMEIKARASRLSREHTLFFATMAYLAANQHSIFYLRGNHDYAVPATSYWTRGERYENTTLKTAAQHGDQWDAINQPPGLGSTGARIARACTLAEGFPQYTDTGAVLYPYAGVDNARPQDSRTLGNFLAGREDSVVAREILQLAGSAVGLASEDIGSYRQARAWRPGWLTTAGHTHMPIAKRGVHYNTGSWQATLRIGSGFPYQESLFHSIPVLLVYLDGAGLRQEEFWLIHVSPTGDVKLQRETGVSIEGVRRAMGYPPDVDAP